MKSELTLLAYKLIHFNGSYLIVSIVLYIKLLNEPYFSGLQVPGSSEDHVRAAGAAEPQHHGVPGREEPERVPRVQQPHCYSSVADTHIE